jgi:hypothetical protein
LLLKVLAAFGKHLRFLLIGTLCMSIAHGVASVLEVCLICRPLAAQWDPDVDGLCGNQMASFAAIEITGLVLDTVIIVSPIPAIMSLRGMGWMRQVESIVALDAGAM